MSASEPAAKVPSDPSTDGVALATATDEVAVDGRTARAERTRTAIVDALLGLLEDGELQPPATRIAERAGISLRLIYHHFGDLESLFRATSERQAVRSRELAVAIDVDVPFEQRLDQFCAQRARVLEWMTPVRRAALLHEPFSPELARVRADWVRAGEREIARVFAAELARFPEDEAAEVLAGLQAVASWSAWDSLRQAGADEATAQAVVRRLVRSTLFPAT